MLSWLAAVTSSQEEGLVRRARGTLYFLFAMLLFLRASALAQGSPGATIFKGKCQLCHGADGTGNTTLGKQLQAANLRSKEVQKKTDAELRKAVHDGNGNMPPFADQLNDSQIDQVLKFVRALGKPKKSSP